MRGYERCWFFGDDFCSKSFEQYFQQRKCVDYNGYTKAHFDTSGFYNNFTSDNPSVISRFASLMSNSMLKKIEKSIFPLPKIVVIVPDDDILKTFGEEILADTTGFQQPCCKIINFIMTEFDRSIASFRENLPAKCIRNQGYPYFLWIHAPLHDNFTNNSARFLFNKALDDMVKVHSSTYSLELKKIWDRSGENLYLKSGRFSVSGYKSYWEAVDKTVRYFDSVMIKKFEKKQFINSQKGQFSQKGQYVQKGQFRWKNPQLNSRFEDDMKFRKLPPPPSHR